MPNVIYNRFKKAIGAGEVDWDDNSGTTIKVMLVNNYTANKDNHQYKSDIDNLGVEVSGQGYTAGGKALTNRTITVDNANDLAKYDADDIEWTNSSITASGAIIYKDTGNANTSILICYVDFGGTYNSQNGNFKIQWNEDGIFTIGDASNSPPA